MTETGSWPVLWAGAGPAPAFVESACAQAGAQATTDPLQPYFAVVAPLERMSAVLQQRAPAIYVREATARILGSGGLIAGRRLVAEGDTAALKRLLGELKDKASVKRRLGASMERAAVALRQAAPTRPASTSERFLQSLVRGAADAIVIVDAAGTVLDWNAAAQEMFGRNPGEARGRHLEECAPALKERWTGNAPFEIRLGTGAAERIVDVRGAAVLDDSGRSLGRSIIARDVTRAARQMAANLALAERLRESEARFRAMVDTIPQLAWMAEPDGYIFWYNRRWYEYTGTTEEQMRGWGWKTVHDPQHLPRVLDRWRASIAQGSPFEMEFPLKGANGRFRWFLTRVLPLKDPATGAVTRWFGTNTDVDETVALVETRTAELRSMVTEYETFAYSVAHDLRAPIRTIRGFGALLLRGFSEGFPEEAKRLLSEVQAAAERMDQLVLDLLAYSRLSRERIDVKPTDLDAAVNRVLENLDADVRKSGGRIDARGPLPAVMAQDSLLDQMLSNLIGNALKFVKPGVAPLVVVRAEVSSGRARVWVEDNGIGISPEFHEKVFKVFERLHGREAYPGTGIGLAIVRRAAERMGGAAGLVSEEGSGSRFWFELPAPPPSQ